MLPPALYPDFTCLTPSGLGKLALHAQFLDTHGMIEMLKPPYTAPLPPKQCVCGQEVPITDFGCSAVKMLSLADISQAQPSTPVLVPAVCQLINNELM